MTTRWLNRKLTCFCAGVLLLLSVSVSAQESLNAGAGTASGTGGSATYSIGQLHFESTESASGSVGAGVQQPIEIYKLAAKTDSKLVISVYPNPASSRIYIQLGSYPSKELQYLLFDMSGKQLAHERITQQQTPISLETFPPGTYMLAIQERHTKLQTFKIIKHF